MANETWRPVTTTYIETRTQDERKYGVTAIIHCDEPLDIAICRRVEEPRYPELDASVEAGDELERWKERCHALEASIAELHEEYEGRHYKTCLYYVKFIVQMRREIDRLRSLLPDAEERAAIRVCIELYPSDIMRMGEADYIADTWLDKLKGEIGE